MDSRLKDVSTNLKQTLVTNSNPYENNRYAENSLFKVRGSNFRRKVSLGGY